MGLSVVFWVECEVFGVECEVFGVECVVFGVECVVFGVECVVFGVECVVFGVECVVCRVEGLTVPDRTASAKSARVTPGGSEVNSCTNQILKSTLRYCRISGFKICTRN